MYRGECNITHGGSGTRLYKIWKQMRIRCYCKTNPTYRFYGARGIKICESWNDFAVFRDWAFSHGYTDELSIDRINAKEDYEPNNCRWITREENLERARKRKFYTYAGKTMMHNEWAKEIGIAPSTLTKRIKMHGVEFALGAGRRIGGKSI